MNVLNDAPFCFEYSIEYPNVPLYLRVSEYLIWAGAQRHDKIHHAKREPKDDLGEELNLYSQIHKHWSAKEDVYLQGAYKDTFIKDMAEKLHRTPASIKSRAYVLRITDPHIKKTANTWTKEEMAILREHYDSTYAGKERIAQLTGRSVGAVKVKAQTMGVAGAYPRGNPKYAKKRL